jgi:hypothetical protein
MIWMFFTCRAIIFLLYIVSSTVRYLFTKFSIISFEETPKVEHFLSITIHDHRVIHMFEIQ